MGIPDHVTSLLINLYEGEEATLRNGHRQPTGSKLGKEYANALYCHPAYLTYMQSTSWEMSGWMKLKLESRLLRKYVSNVMCRWHQPNGRKWRGTKEPFNEDEKGDWETWLKTQHSKNEDYPIQSHYFVSNREKIETDRLYFLICNITADGDCSHEIKRHSLKEKLWQTYTGS